MFQTYYSGILISRTPIFSILPITWSKGRLVKRSHFTPDFTNSPISFPLEVPKIGIPLCFRNDNSFIRRENWERFCFLIRFEYVYTTNAFRHFVIFSGKKVASPHNHPPSKSEGARTSVIVAACNCRKNQARNFYAITFRPFSEVFTWSIPSSFQKWDKRCSVG